MTISELRYFHAFRVAVTMRSGIVHPGVLHVEEDGAVRILQPIPPGLMGLEAEQIASISLVTDVGWPVTNASTAETDAAANLLRPYEGRDALLQYDDRTVIGVVKLDERHGWVLRPGSIPGQAFGIVIQIAALRDVTSP